MKKGLLLGLLAAVNLALVAVLTGVQFSHIPTRWSIQQWVFAVVLPSTAVLAQVTGAAALWMWFNGARSRGRYRARHAWQTRRWIVRTSSIMGEPEAMAVRIR